MQEHERPVIMASISHQESLSHSTIAMTFGIQINLKSSYTILKILELISYLVKCDNTTLTEI